MIVHRDDGRYAHVPECNERCDESGHWLQQAVPAPWQQAKVDSEAVAEAADLGGRTEA